MLLERKLVRWDASLGGNAINSLSRTISNAIAYARLYRYIIQIVPNFPLFGPFTYTTDIFLIRKKECLLQTAFLAPRIRAP